MSIRTALTLAVAATLLMAATSVHAASMDIDPLDDFTYSVAVQDVAVVGLTPTQGRGLATAGMVVQGFGLGLSVASIFTGYMIAPSLPFHLASIPMAPLTVAGFSSMLGDGTRGGHLRGISVGLLEGALYSGLVAGLRGAAMAVHDLQCQQAFDSWDGDGFSPCFEDFTNFFLFGYMLPHAVVALGMLIPGIITAGQARHGDAGVAARALPPINLVPLAGPEFRGLAISGRF